MSIWENNSPVGQSVAFFGLGAILGPDQPWASVIVVVGALIGVIDFLMRNQKVK